MDLAFTFMYLSLRCFSNEVEICALSTSMRQDALGFPVAALTGVESGSRTNASTEAKKVIGRMDGFGFVVMLERGKFPGVPRKLSTLRGKNGGG